MKKMILLVSMLAGIMTFSGCVDDKESPSVSAVRQAKAAQLTALAALSNAQAAQAQAQADKIKALTEAEVAYQQALAEYQQAQADHAKAEAQERMAQAQNEIQRLANELEQMAIQHKIDMLKKQTEYENELKNADDKTATLLGGLYTAYQTAATNLFDAQNDIAQKKIELARMQAGIVDDEEAQTILINIQNRKIAAAEQTIAENKAMLAVYEALQAPDEAKAELATARGELTKLQNASKAALEAIGTASTDKSNAVNKMNAQTYKKYAKYFAQYPASAQKFFFNEDGSRFIDYIALQNEEVSVLGKPVAATVGTWYFEAVDKDGKKTYTEVMKALDTDNIKKSIALDNGVEQNYDYDVYTSYYQLNESGVKAYIDSISANIKKNEGVLLKKAQTDLADAQKAVADQQKKIADLEKATPKDEAAIAAAKADLENVLQPAVAAAQTNVNVKTADLEKANEQLAAIQEVFDSMAAEAENWNAAVEALNVANEAFCDAALANSKADYDESVQQQKVNALNAIVNGTVVGPDGNEYHYDPTIGSSVAWTVSSAISACEKNIQNAMEAIQEANEAIIKIENQDLDTSIAELENEIALAEAEIPVLQAIADKAKAALEAATAAQGE